MAKGKTNPGIEHSKLIECFRLISIKQPLFNFNFIKAQSPLNFQKYFGTGYELPQRRLMAEPNTQI